MLVVVGRRDNYADRIMEYDKGSLYHVGAFVSNSISVSAVPCNCSICYCRNNRGNSNNFVGCCIVVPYKGSVM